MFYLSQERTFYSWDNAFYADQTLASADAFRHSLHGGARFIRASLTQEYLLLYTIPLVPCIWLLGASRAAYIIAVYAVYFTPFLLLASELARRMFPEEEVKAARLAAVFTVATPASWVMILRGYPDIGGAALVAAALLLYERSDIARRWQPLLAAGLLAGSAALLRRGYVYSVIALYAAFAVDLAIHALAEREQEGTSGVLRRLLRVFVMGLSTCALVYLVAPVFIRNALNSSYRQYFVGWQQPASITLLTMLDTLGALVVLFALSGFVLLRRVTLQGRHAARVLLLATAAWIVVWAFHAHQPAYHYPQILPLAAVLGLTSLWLGVNRIQSRRVALSVKSVITIVVLMNLLATVPITPLGMELAEAIPHYVISAPIPPLVNPAYDEIVRLVAYLRSQAQPHDHVLIAGSSRNLNYDVLQAAERTTYGGNPILQVDTAPPMDALGVLPTPNLLRAAYVVLARPIQYQTSPDREKVVTVLVTAFDEHWPVAGDFELLPGRFTLGQPGTEIRVYKRVRPPSDTVMADTAKRVLDFMAGRTTPPQELLTADVWFAKSSPYPVEVIANVNGTYDIIAHPARVSEQPPTVLAMAPKAVDRLRISAGVEFLDARCYGVAIQLTAADAPEASVVSAGVFTPERNGASFDVLLSQVREKKVLLMVKSTPRDPENNAFCTVRVTGLQAKAQ